MGAFSRPNGNAIEDSSRDAIEDGDLTYTLGFYPASDDRAGQWHKLKVTVNRRGVTLRYREPYFAARESDVALQRPTLDCGTRTEGIRARSTFPGTSKARASS